MRHHASVLLLVLVFGTAGCVAEKRPTRGSIAVQAFEAQTETAGCVLTGEVRDDCGGVLKGAGLQLTGEGMTGSLGAVTGEDGRFSLNLPPKGGPFRLRVDSRGYFTVALRGFSCPGGTHLDLAAVVSPCGSDCEPIVLDSDPVVLYRSTTSGARVSIDERTGEPSVHPY